MEQVQNPITSEVILEELADESRLDVLIAELFEIDDGDEDDE